MQPNTRKRRINTRSEILRERQLKRLSAADLQPSSNFDPATHGRFSPARRHHRSRDAEEEALEDDHVNNTDQENALGARRLRHPTLQRNLTRSYIVPWGYQLPELVDFYLHNPFDFTGINIYTHESRYQPAWGEVTMRSPPSFTVSTCIAEQARVNPLIRQQQILWLKAKALAMTNQALRSGHDVLSCENIFSVVGLAFQDLMFEEGIAATHHLRGIQQMVRLRGGFETLIVPLRKLVVEADSLNSYLNHSAPLFPIEMLPPGWATDTNHPFPLMVYDKGWTHSVRNPLRLAFQPIRSDLSQARLRNHLVISFLGPAQAFFLVLCTIQSVAEGALLWPYSLSPIEAKAQIERLEMYLLTDWTPLKRPLRLESPIFSDQDRAYHDLLASCARSCALILIAQLVDCMDRTPLSSSKVDHNAMQFGLVDLNPVIQRNPEVACWLLFLGNAFVAEGPQKDLTVDRLTRLCGSLGLRSWSATRELLRSVFFCGILLDDFCFGLWESVELKMNNPAA